MNRILALAVLPILIFGQAPPSFDVAVIKPADPANNRLGMGFGPNGRTLTVDGLTVLGMVRLAYGLFADQLVLNPSLTNISSWADSDRFDILAKSEGTAPVSRDQQNAMFQQLLGARFGLKIHRDKKEITIYSLVAGKNGPKMKQGEAAAPYLSAPAPGRLVGTKASMASLASALGGRLGRPVFDDTGLAGGFDFSLSWVPDGMGGDPAVSDASGPSIFTALQDQLGLRLESKKAPVDVIVVDAVERPSVN